MQIVPASGHYVKFGRYMMPRLFVAGVLILIVVVAYMAPGDYSGARTASQPVRINVVQAPPPPTQAEVAAAEDAILRGRLFQWSLLVLFVLGVLSLIYRFGYVPAVNARERLEASPDTGIFPVAIKPVTRPMQRLHGEHEMLSVNPNMSTAAATSIRMNGSTDIKVMHDNDMLDDLRIDYAKGLRYVQSLAAKFGANPGRGGMSREEGKMISGESRHKAREAAAKADRAELMLHERQQKKLPVLEEPERPVHAPAVDEAIATSKESGFVVGYTDDGLICKINLQASIHCAIIGSTGTGKTASIGMKMVVDCLRHGYHTIILDGMGGDDLGVFSDHAEWYDSTPANFAQQLAALIQEHERRLAQCGGDKQAKKSLTPIAVFVEEFNEIWSKMEPEQAEFAEPLLDTLIAKARHTRIHLIFIGQESEEWPKTIFNIKAKVVFQTGVREAQRLGEWHAQHLPDNGEFLYRMQRYKAWLWEDEYKRFLPTNGANRGRRILETRTIHERSTNGYERTANAPRTPTTNARSPEVRTATNADERHERQGVSIPQKNAKGTPPTPIVRAFATGATWDDIGKKFFEIFPDGTQSKLRGIMSQLDGREPKSFKGEAYRVYHSYSPNGDPRKVK